MTVVPLHTPSPTRRAARVLGWIALVTVVALPLLALGQTAAVPDPDQLGAFLGAVLQAVQAGQWPTVGVLALVGAVWALRRFAVKLPGAVGAFFAGSEGGTIIAFVGAGVTALAAAYFGGVPLTGALLVTAVKAGFVAIGAWTGARRLLRLLVPVVAKIPKVGDALAKVLAYVSGADFSAKVTAAADAAYKPLAPAPSAAQADQALFPKA